MVFGPSNGTFNVWLELSATVWVTYQMLRTSLVVYSGWNTASMSPLASQQRCILTLQRHGLGYHPLITHWANVDHQLPHGLLY